MSDERYDRSADMRLLELQREALGKPSRVIGSTSYSDPDSLSDSSKYEDEAYVQSGTILVAAIDARPRTALIPGALVTVSLSIANDGDVLASGVHLSLPLPEHSLYRQGTIAVDGTTGSDDVASDLFGNGAALADIEPGARRTLTLKLIVEAGLNDIVLLPYLSVRSGAVLGLRAMRLTRKAGSSRKAAVERPFYESDDSEQTREPLASSSESVVAAVLPVSEYPPVIHAVPPMTQSKLGPPDSIVTEAGLGKRIVDKAIAKKPVPSAPVDQTVSKAVLKRATEPKVEPKTRAKPKAKPKAKAKAKSQPMADQDDTSHSKLTAEPIVQTVRAKIEVVRSHDDSISFTGRGGPILAVRIDRKRLATLTGLFNGESLGMIAHYLVLNALAVRDPLPGDGSDNSIAAFVASQEQLLSRALISMRLGRTPAPDSVGAVLPAFPPALKTHTESRAIEAPTTGEAMLFRAFQPSEVLFVTRMLSNAGAAPFMRAAQLFVGLCANDAVVPDEPERHRVGIALTAYAALATAEISRIFLRAKLNKAPELFKNTDQSFDEAARTVLSAVARSIA